MKMVKISSENPCNQADRKSVSVIYLSIGTVELKEAELSVVATPISELIFQLQQKSGASWRRLLLDPETSHSIPICYDKTIPMR